MEATYELSYSALQAASLAGITYRQLDYWARTGLVLPTVGADGSGSRRSYSAFDVLKLKVTKVLMAKRVTHDAIDWALRMIEHRPDYLWVQGGIVGTGGILDLHDALRNVTETVVVNVAALAAETPADVF